MNIEKAKQVFKEYVNNYDLSNPHIDGKYWHSLRVVDCSEKIARSLNLSEEDIEHTK